MASVDPADDCVSRWVLQHYSYDPDRGQRRNVIVAAFDNRGEFGREMDRYAQLVRDASGTGQPPDGEWVSGVEWPPGYHAEQAPARAVRRAVKHGADPRRLVDGGPLPPGMAVSRLSTREH